MFYYKKPQLLESSDLENKSQPEEFCVSKLQCSAGVKCGDVNVVLKLNQRARSVDRPDPAEKR